MAIDGNWVENTPHIPLIAWIHPPTPPKHTWTLQNSPRHTKHAHMSPMKSLSHFQALIRESERHIVCQGPWQGMSGGTLGEMRVLDDVCWVSGMSVSVWGCLWQCLGFVKGDMWVCGYIWGCLGGVGGCKGDSGRCLVVFSPSISFNFEKSQMRSLTFSSRPGGSRYRKYQNVPKLR